MSVVIGCDSFLALRNVRNGDLARHLSEEVHVWVNPNQYEGSLAARPDGVHMGMLEEFNPRAELRLHRLLQSAYLARKCHRDPVTQWVVFKGSSYRNNRENGVRRAASLARAAVRLARYCAAGLAGMAQRWRPAASDMLRAHPAVETYRRRLQDVDASVVASFSPEGYREMVLIEAANSLGIPTAVMVRSRDNLAAKILHLPDAAAYLVWSQETRQCLLHMYPEITEDRVHAAGSPQFDHHLDPAFRLDRQAFFELVGLDPERPLVVYTTATPGLIDHEIEITQHLADAAHAGAFARGAQLLVRGHPRMFGSDIELLHREYPAARCYPRPTTLPFRSAAHEALVVRRIIEDEPVHLATLAYQDVQVNVCGTMTIDSAIFDKPAVNVYYDLRSNILGGLSVRRFYERSDVRQMMAYGASRLARDPDECIRHINRYLLDPSLDAEGRARARDLDCGPLDGRAGQRIAELLNRLGLTQSNTGASATLDPAESTSC
jgi:hypothetical protein